MTWDEMQTELQRNFSEISTHNHATKELRELNRSQVRPLGSTCTSTQRCIIITQEMFEREQDDPTRIFHFLMSLQNTAITDKIARYDDLPKNLVECSEEALKLENKYQLCEGLNSNCPQDRGPKVMMIEEIHPHYEGSYNHAHFQVIHIEEIFHIDTDDISQIQKVIDHHARSNACYYCSEVHHFKRDCPRAKQAEVAHCAAARADCITGSMTHTYTTESNVLEDAWNNFIKNQYTPHEMEEDNHER